MAKAATQLAISQPAISRAIADMEHTLGVALLDRSPRGVEPTRYGHALLQRGRAVFDELKHGVQDIEFLADPGAGELHIASATGLSEGIVLAVIDRLSRKYPKVVFHVVAVGLPAQYQHLRERRVEIGLARISEPDAQDDMAAEMLFEEPLVVAAGIDSPWSRRRAIKLAELVGEPWTWPAPGTVTDTLIVEAFRASGLQAPRASVYAEATNLRLRLAATGRFLAVVTASVMRFPAKNPLVKTLPVTLPTTESRIGIITQKNRTLSPLAQLFIECAREIAKPLAKSTS
jgi:DNA-binding transcriptional LysR family regulator